MARQKTKTTAEVVSAYIKRAYDRIEVKVTKDRAAEFKAKCQAEGTNPNKIINAWIADYISTQGAE